MISKRVIKQILLDNRQLVESFKIVHRDVLDGLHCTADNPLGCKVFVGLRRAGKSFVLFEKMQQLLQSGHSWDEMLYLSFEDERLEGIDASDLNALLECHIEMGGSERPMFFLDEVQNVAGWDKYARRMADAKHQMWITGSNAKMLSSEIMTTLGGRPMRKIRQIRATARHVEWCSCSQSQEWISLWLAKIHRNCRDRPPRTGSGHREWS